MPAPQFTLGLPEQQTAPSESPFTLGLPPTEEQQQAQQQAEQTFDKYRKPETIFQHPAVSELIDRQGRIMRMGGDKGANEYADWATANYEHEAGVSLDEKQRPQVNDAFRDAARQAQMQSIGQTVNSGQPMLSNPALEFIRKVGKVIPGAAQGIEYREAQWQRDAQERWNKGEATHDDMVVLAHQQRDEQIEKNKTLGQMAGDFAMGTPKAMIEWAAPGGVGGKALGGLAGRIGFPALTHAALGTIGGVMTDTPLSEIGKNLASTTATAAIFGVGNPFGATEAGKGFARHLMEGVTAIQADKAAQSALKGQLPDLVSGDPEKAKKGLQSLLVDTLGLGLLHAGTDKVNAWEQRRDARAMQPGIDALQGKATDIQGQIAALRGQATDELRTLRNQLYGEKQADLLKRIKESGAPDSVIQKLSDLFDTANAARNLHDVDEQVRQTLESVGQEVDQAKMNSAQTQAIKEAPPEVVADLAPKPYQTPEQIEALKKLNEELRGIGHVPLPETPAASTSAAPEVPEKPTGGNEGPEAGGPPEATENPPAGPGDRGPLPEATAPRPADQGPVPRTEGDQNPPAAGGTNGQGSGPPEKQADTTGKEPASTAGDVLTHYSTRPSLEDFAWERKLDPKAPATERLYREAYPTDGVPGLPRGGELLNEREREVINRHRDGQSFLEIGDALGFSDQTAANAEKSGLAKYGHTPDTYYEGLRRASALAERDKQRDEKGRDISGQDINGPPAGGFGASGGGYEGTPPVDAPTAGAGQPAPPPSGPPASKSYLKRAQDWLKTVAQQTFPATTRLARQTGEALGRLANVKSAAETTLEHFSYLLRVGTVDKDGRARSVPLAELSPDERKMVGATFLEKRFRYFRDALMEKARGLWAQAAQAEKAGDIDKAHKLASAGTDAKVKADKVVTLIGGKDSPLKDEKAYQESLENLDSFFQAWIQEWRPEVEKNFRGIMGMDPDEAIDSLSQIPGLPINARAMAPGEKATPGTVYTAKRGALSNIRVNKAGLTKEAGLDAPAYDVDIVSMMQHTLQSGGESARKAEFFRQAIQDGVIKMVEKGGERPQGWPSLETKPSRGLPELPSGAGYYVNPDAEREIRSGLSIDVPASKHVPFLTAVAQIVNSAAIMAPVEIETHVFNHVKALFAPGMGTPIWNLKDTFFNAYQLITHNPDISAKVMELAKMNAAFSHPEKNGLAQTLLGSWFPEAKINRYDPTYWTNKFTGKFIDVMQKAVRVQLGDAFDRMAKSGDFPGTETAKRDFINQAVGNYNSLASNRITQFLKDTGLQPFATAATTFTTGGVRQLAGGIMSPTTSHEADVRLRATAFAKMLPLMAMGPVLNQLLWGNAFPTNTPAFAVKTGEKDDKEGKGKTTLYVDPLRIAGIRRGARTIGLNAVSERVLGVDRDGKENLGDRVLKDAGHSILHWGMGPIGQAALETATGEDAYGHRIAPTISKAQTALGKAKAEKLGKPEAGSSQYWENFKGSLGNVNQAAGTLLGADRPKTPRTAGENINRLLGPFGIQERRPVKK